MANESCRAKRTPLKSGLPRTHANCKDEYGVGRPGKTACDKANGHIPYQKNRRMWDDKEKAWVKV